MRIFIIWTNGIPVIWNISVGRIFVLIYHLIKYVISDTRYVITGIIGWRLYSHRQWLISLVGVVYPNDRKRVCYFLWWVCHQFLLDLPEYMDPFTHILQGSFIGTGTIRESCWCSITGEIIWVNATGTNPQQSTKRAHESSGELYLRPHCLTLLWRSSGNA